MVDTFHQLQPVSGPETFLMLTRLLVVVTLVALRCFSAMILIPAVRAYVGVIGVGVFSLAVAILITLPSGVGASLLDPSQLSVLQILALAIREVLIGAAISLPLVIFFESVVIFGRLSDVSRGSQFAEQLNPALGERSSALEGLAALAVGLIFFTQGGAEILIQGILGTLGKEGVGSGRLAVGVLNFPLEGSSYVLLLIRDTGIAIARGVCVSAPIILVCLVLDFGAGIASRMIPRLNLGFELLPAKLCIGVLLVGFVAAGGGGFVREILVASRGVQQWLLTQ